MNNLLKILIYRLKTVDGRKGSAEVFLNKMYTDKCKRNKYGDIIHMSEDRQMNLRQLHEAQIFRKVYMKYMVIRMRAKISFEALKKCVAIKELIIISALKAF